MGEASEGRSRRAMEALSLLQRFSEESKVVVGEEEEEIEVNLNLGLSLGGRFGVDKSSSSKLVRSSSIAGSIPILSGAAASSAPALARTASLPVETEEQWRKRKELQSLRRMEAKRRRSEKQRSSTAAPASLEEIDGEDLKEKQHFATANRSGSAGLPSWAAAARTAVAGGSVETVGGSSSGNSELESKTSQGRSSCGEERSSAGSIQSNQEESEKANKNECRTPKATTGREGAMEDMPCVFTKGDGPNGRRVDGILYKYGKGEEVRIMCVCHGSFLSPADFVKHAGGRDVSHPLRHIVINPSASTSLS